MNIVKLFLLLLNCNLMSAFNKSDISALKYVIPNFLSVNNKSTLVQVYDDPTGSSVCGILAKYTFGLWHPQAIVNMNEELMNRTILKRDTLIDQLAHNVYENIYTFLDIRKQSVFVMLPTWTSYKEMYEFTDSIVYLQPDYDFVVVINDNCNKILLEYPLRDMLLKICIKPKTADVYRSCYACNRGKEMVYKSSNLFNNSNIYNQRSYEESDLNGKQSRIVTLECPKNSLNAIQRFKNGEYVRPDAISTEQYGLLLNATFELYELDDNGIDMVKPQHENGSWTGVAGELLYKDTEYTIFILPYLRMFRILSVGQPYLHANFIMATGRPKKMLNKYIMIQPFAMATWICIIVGVSFTGMVLVVFFKAERIIRRGETSNYLHMFVAQLTYILRSLLLQPNGNVLSENNPSRLIISCWFFVSLVLITGYTSKMTALESVPPMTFIPRTDDEFVDNEQWKVKVPYLYHVVIQYLLTQLHELLDRGYDLRKTLQLDKAGYSFMRREVASGSVDDCLQEALEKETFCGAFSIHMFMSLQHFLDGYGALQHEVTPHMLYTQSAYVGYRHGIPHFKPVERINVHYGIEGGYFNWLIHQTNKLDRVATYLKKMNNSNLFDDGIEYQNIPKPLTMASLFAPGTVLLGGIALGFIALYFERFVLFITNYWIMARKRKRDSVISGLPTVTSQDMPSCSVQGAQQDVRKPVEIKSLRMSVDSKKQIAWSEVDTIQSLNEQGEF